VNSVNIEENIMKVKLTLPWKYHTFIHYTVFSFWPPSSRPEWSRCRVEVIHFLVGSVADPSRVSDPESNINSKR
jgi:hypothetical protein